SMPRNSEVQMEIGFLRKREKSLLNRCSEETVCGRNAHRESAPAGERGPRVQRHWNTAQVDWSGSVRASAGFPSSRPNGCNRDDVPESRPARSLSAGVALWLGPVPQLRSI